MEEKLNERPNIIFVCINCKKYFKYEEVKIKENTGNIVCPNDDCKEIGLYAIDLDRAGMSSIYIKFAPLGNPEDGDVEEVELISTIENIITKETFNKMIKHLKTKYNLKEISDLEE